MLIQDGKYEAIKAVKRRLEIKKNKSNKIFIELKTSLASLKSSVGIIKCHIENKKKAFFKVQRRL